jgi:hypothetical protein
MPTDLEPLSALLRRYVDDNDERNVVRARLTDALAGRDDPMKIIEYVKGLGIDVRELDDLLAINADDSEEELHSFRVQEGVAISIASDGLWVLFTP